MQVMEQLSDQHFNQSRMGRRLPPDITRRNHKSDNCSNDANEFVQPKKPDLCERIHTFISDRGKRGATTNEVAAALALKVQTVSARMSEMKCVGAQFEIFWNGEKRATLGARPGRVFVTSKGQIK